MKFEIREVRGEAEKEAVRGLIRREFEVRPGVGEAFAALYKDLLKKDPLVLEKGSRVAIVEGRVVGHILLAPRSFVVDGVPLRGGILSLTVVDPKWRGMGIGTALVTDAIDLGIEMGLAVLHVAGDLRFYRRFGFVDSYTRCRMTTDTEFPRNDEGSLKLREARESDAAELARLSSQEAPSGAVQLSPERWAWLMDTGHPTRLLETNDALLGFRADFGMLFLLEGKQNLLGYLRTAGQGRELAVYECATISEDASRELLGELGWWARGNGYEELSFHLPASNRASRLAAERGDVEIVGDPELLIRILDFSTALEAMRDILTTRLRESDRADWRGQIVFGMEKSRLCLILGEDGVGLGRGVDPAGEAWEVHLPEIGLARAIWGTDRLSDRARKALVGKEEVGHVLDVLFPPLDPYFWLADSL